MSFALFYNRQDASQVAAEVGRPDLSAGDRTLANALWNGGFKNWATAAVAPSNSPYFGEGVAAGNPTLIFICTSNSITKAQLVNLLNRLAATSASYYLANIAADIALTAIEPWPPA